MDEYQSPSFRSRKPQREQLICNVRIRFESHWRNIWELQKLWVKRPHIPYILHLHHNQSQSLIQFTTTTTTKGPRSPDLFLYQQPYQTPTTIPKANGILKKAQIFMSISQNSIFFHRNTNTHSSNYDQRQEITARKRYISSLGAEKPQISIDFENRLFFSALGLLHILKLRSKSLDQRPNKDEWEMEKSMGIFSEIKENLRGFRHFRR